MGKKSAFMRGTVRSNEANCKTDSMGKGEEGSRDYFFKQA